jgi:hypothetical protein
MEPFCSAAVVAVAAAGNLDDMGADPQDYRGKAIACDQIAKQTTDRTIKRQWDKLAMQVASDGESSRAIVGRGSYARRALPWSELKQ